MRIVFQGVAVPFILVANYHVTSFVDWLMSLNQYIVSFHCHSLGFGDIPNKIPLGYHIRLFRITRQQSSTLAPLHLILTLQNILIEIWFYSDKWFAFGTCPINKYRDNNNNQLGWAVNLILSHLKNNLVGDGDKWCGCNWPLDVYIRKCDIYIVERHQN